MERLRENFVRGTVLNDPLSDSDTTLDSTGLAELQEVIAGQYAVIILDPSAVNGAPEIVYVTAHDDDATDATISRGEEGSTPREHPQGTTWIHGSTSEDFNNRWELVIDEDGSSLANFTATSASVSGGEILITSGGKAVHNEVLRMSNFKFEVDIKLDSTSGSAWYGGVSTVPRDRTSVTGGCTSRIQYESGVVSVEGELTGLTLAGIKPVPGGALDTWYTLMVISTGGVCDVYLNGVFQFTFQIASNGALDGLALYVPTGGHVRYRNFKVWIGEGFGAVALNPAENKMRLHDFVAGSPDYDYVGVAYIDAPTNSPVWKITRITINSDGSTSTGIANNVEWDDRYTETYS